MTRLAREDVLRLFRRYRRPMTTLDVAERLGAREACVRGCIAWLLASGALEEAGSVTRRDKEGRKYSALEYRATGIKDLDRIPRDPIERRAKRDAITLLEMRDYLRMRWGKVGVRG